MRHTQTHLRALLMLIVGLVPASALGWTAGKAEATACMTRWYDHTDKGLQIAVTTDSAGIDAIPAATVRAHVQSAMATWNQVQCGLCASLGGSGCPPIACDANPLGLTLVDGGIGAHTPTGLPCGTYNPDGVTCKTVAGNGNYVLAATQAADWHWGQLQVANTVVTANTVTGEIIDADIVLNMVTPTTGQKFQACADADCAQKPAAYPLCITLTHELGHVLGLNHSAVAKSVMEASAVPSQTYKCALADDDVAGVCTLYRTTCSGQPGEITPTPAQCAESAAANTPATTPPTPAPACQAARVPSLAAGWLLVVAAALVARRRVSSSRPAKETARATGW